MVIVIVVMVVVVMMTMMTFDKGGFGGDHGYGGDDNDIVDAAANGFSGDNGCSGGDVESNYYDVDNCGDGCHAIRNAVEIDVLGDENDTNPSKQILVIIHFLYNFRLTEYMLSVKYQKHIEVNVYEFTRFFYNLK